MEQKTLLQWVDVDGETRHVSEFKHLSPPARPRALCPACGHPVVMKLGTKKAHHAAHAPESLCILTSPETVIHFNSKMHLARELAQADPKELYLTQTCPSCYRKTRDILWVKDWDEVNVEKTVDSALRPDILLLATGKPIAAIEIFVTHAVEHEKEQKLRSIGLPWSEVKGNPDLYSEEKMWRVSSPLPIYRTSHLFAESWICESCHDAKLAEQERKEWVELNGIKYFQYKLIDLFFPNGRWMRNLFSISYELNNGTVTGFMLTRQKTSWNYDRIQYFEGEEEIIDTIDTSSKTDNVIERLKDTGRLSLKKLKSGNVIIDSPMDWVMGEPKEFGFYDLRNFPRRYLFNQSERKWFIPPNRKNTRWFDERGRMIREISYWHRP